MTQIRQRFTVLCVDEPFIHALPVVSDNSECSEESVHPVLIDMMVNHHTVHAAQLLCEGMRFNALSSFVDSDGVWHPRYIVVEPDFLLDVTSVTSCVKSWGESPFNYFIDKLRPSETTEYTLLGDVANQFLDDVFNLPNATCEASLKKIFVQRALDFTATHGIGKSFFDEATRQFSNIQRVVNELLGRFSQGAGTVDVHLEPSFFCEALGLQGRMDCLVDVNDKDEKILIELKSGKWDEWRGCAKEEHLMQMLLYKEILYYNSGVEQDKVRGNLLYSKYPYLQEQPSTQEVVFRAMNIRNNIVVMELGLQDGKARQWVPKLTAESLRRNPSCSEKFWQNWCLPKLQPMLDALHGMDELTEDYFHTFLQFVVREQFVSSVGDGKVDSTRAFASLWNADVNTKLENGDICVGARLVDVRENDGVEAVCLAYQQTWEQQPNFRIGDSVILYRRLSDDDTAITQQVIRCNVEKYENGCIWLQLKYPQRDHSVFDESATYAIEHDHVNANFRSLYSGLFSLVTCAPSRRDMLLCQRTPTPDELFLLMGPPGTGKTSIALKRMVETHMAKGDNILLLAYTNRAVDEICQMLSTIDVPPDYIRLGRELACAPAYHDHLSSRVFSSLPNRRAVKEKIEETRVFVSTVASMNGHLELLRLKHFNVAIFDEASQLLEPQIMGLMTSPAIDKFVMIGDHKQLPAVVQQSEDASVVTSDRLRAIGLSNCRNSLFERLYEQLRQHADLVAMLDHQGRMHPAIATFASDAFYDGLLLPVGLQHQKEGLPYKVYDSCNAVESLVATRRMAFVNVPSPQPEHRLVKANVDEACTIAQIVLSVQTLCEKNGLPFDPSSQLGIIVPFRRQIAMVRLELEKVSAELARKIVVDTVERYQGSQRDIIIYGTTITQPYELEVLSNLTATSSGTMIDRKLNVAVTRARKQLFVLGDECLLRQNVLYSQLIDYCEEKKTT